jgi:hypothetical protein
MFEGRGVVREVPLSLAIVRGLTFKRVGLLGRNATRRGQYRNGKRGSDARSFCPRREASALNRSPLWNVSPLTIARERGTSRAAPRPRGYGQFPRSPTLAGMGNFAVPGPPRVRQVPSRVPRLSVRLEKRQGANFDISSGKQARVQVCAVAPGLCHEQGPLMRWSACSGPHVPGVYS